MSPDFAVTSCPAGDAQKLTSIDTVDTCITGTGFTSDHADIALAVSTNAPRTPSCSAPSEFEISWRYGKASRARPSLMLSNLTPAALM